MSNTKEYLGDAVYAETDNGRIKLTTENGICVTNTIYLESEVFEALCRFAEAKNYRPRDRPLDVPRVIESRHGWGPFWENRDGLD